MRKRRTIIIPATLAHSATGSILAGSADAEPEPAPPRGGPTPDAQWDGHILDQPYSHSAESKWNAERAAQLRLTAVHWNSSG